ncbi:hypothetical protein QQX98_001278 [Neonectria punicea]|uniref:Zn(2)-C6 fungal-type domain-containing protein n=1 Tax=Neonectria punicea TaxID=979145 RepID=A0ABR1HQI0_9HYPO
MGFHAPLPSFSNESIEGWKYELFADWADMDFSFDNASCSFTMEPMDLMGFDFPQPTGAEPAQTAPIQSIDSAANIGSSPGSPIRPVSSSTQLTTPAGVQRSPLAKKRGVRGPFKTTEERLETGLTRHIGACIRCIKQKARCVRDPDNPDGECLTCKRVSAPRLIHYPCLRKRLTDTSYVTAKSDPGLFWTKRWKSLDVVDINHWASPEVKMIELTQANSSLRWAFRVRQFVPQEGDSLERTWLSKQTGVRKYHPVTPYGLLSMKEAAKSFSKSLDNDMDTIIDEIAGVEKTWLAETYRMAHKHSKEAESRSERICSMETIGIDPQQQDPDRHDYGYVPVPPVVSAQITIIAETLFFRPLQIQIRKRLDRLIGTKNCGVWFTTYLVCMLLLHNCALITGYNFRKAKNLRLSQRYAAADALQDLHAPLFQEIKESNMLHHEYYFISQLFDDQWVLPTATIASIQ